MKEKSPRNSIPRSMGEKINSCKHATKEMEQTIAEYPNYLEETEELCEVPEVLRMFRPGSLREHAGEVRLTWVEAYGSSHNGGRVRSDIRRMTGAQAH